MSFFAKIPDALGVIHCGGVYSEAPLFLRDGKVHAKRGAGYVRLSQGGATSAKNIRWATLETPHGQWRETGGHVEYIADPVPVAEAAE